MENEGNMALALREVSKCFESLNCVKEALLEVLGDVNGGFEDREGILGRWNGLRDALEEQRQYVLSVISEAEEFMSSPSFKELDSLKKVDYWESVNASRDALDNIMRKCGYYYILSRVEHTEQTVDFLWDTFESVKSYFFILRGHKELGSRGLARHMNGCVRLRDRLCVEICNLMNLLEEVIGNDGFETMVTERKELYHAKWRTYLQKCHELNGN